MNAHPSQEIPDIPSELAGPLPRKIRLSPNLTYQQIVFTVGMGLFAILVLWMCIGAVHQMRQRTALRQRGAEVIGEMTHLGRAGKAGYMVHYTFAANGRTFSGNAEVPDELMHSLGDSNSLTVRYLPSDPRINQPAAWEWSFLQFCIGISIPMIIVAGSGIWLKTLYRRRQLLKLGTPVAGVLTQCARKWFSFSFKYEFSTYSGKTVRGSGRSSVWQDIGADIWILYLPQNPSHNVPYPDSTLIVDPGSSATPRP